MTRVKTVTAGNYTHTLDISLVSQNIAANTSLISYAYKITFNGGTPAFSGSPYTFRAIINGTNNDESHTFNFGTTTTYTMSSGTQTITHRADGTKTISAGLDGPTTSFSGGFPEASGTGSYTLKSIPRASTPTFDQGGPDVTSVDAGTALTLTTNRSSSAFTHDITYSFGATSGTIGSGVGASTTWTPPLSLLNQIPTSTAGTATITTDTFDASSNLIGTTSVSLTITAPSTVIPTISTVTATEATTSPAVATIVGGFVQSISKLAVAMTGATGVYSSTIVSRTLTIDGQTISGTSGTTAIITGSGTLVLTGTVVDSRGRIGTRTANITILPYAPPLVSTFTVKRATSGGTIDPNGTYFSINLIAAVQSLIVGTQKNSIDYKFKRQPRGGTTAWSAVTADVSTHVSSTGVSTTILPGTYSIANSYDVRIEVTDALGVTTAVQGTVSTGGVLMNWSTTYDGIGVGKYWSQGSIDALSQIYQNNGNAVIDITNTATTAVFGIVKLASDSDAVTGTDTARAVTPHADAAALAAADKAWGLPTFASSAARDTFYGTAAQGQRCIRSDKGWVEMYYALYNSGTNPGGASVAGWYPIAGLLPVVEHADTSNLALTTSATTVTSWTETYRRNASSISSGVWTCAQAGRYLVNVFINMGASVSSATNLLLNGSAPVITGDTDGGGSTLGGYNTLTAEVNMAVGDTLEVHATRSAGNATDRRWSISYIRPY